MPRPIDDADRRSIAGLQLQSTCSCTWSGGTRGRSIALYRYGDAEEPKRAPNSRVPERMAAMCRRTAPGPTNVQEPSNALKRRGTLVARRDAPARCGRPSCRAPESSSGYAGAFRRCSCFISRNPAFPGGSLRPREWQLKKFRDPMDRALLP